MNEQSNPLHDERLSTLYRAIPQTEPPEWLDQRILLAAKARVDPSGPLPVAVSPKRRSSRWRVPLALAATVVLSVGVVRLVRESGELATAPSLEVAKTTASLASQADTAQSGVSQAKPAEENAHPQAAASAMAPSAPLATPVVPQSLAPPAPLAERARTVDPKPAGSSQPSFHSQELTKPEKLNGETSHARKVPPKADEKPSFRASPERWLQEIAKLRHQGETLKAEAEWLEFKRHYPHYPLAAPDADSQKQ